MVSFEEIPMTVQAAKAIITQVLLGCEAERSMGPRMWRCRGRNEAKPNRDGSETEAK